MPGDSIPESTKLCTKCHISYPLTSDYFYRQTARRDGFGNICKECSRGYYPQQAVQRQENSEAIKIRKRQYHKDHAEEIGEKKRKKRKENPQKYREQKQKSYQKNTAVVQKRNNAWKKANPEKCQLLAQKRAARIRELPSTFTMAEWEFALAYWHNACAICGNAKGFFWTLAMDHWIPLASPQCPGSIASNILPMCHGDGGCNNLKGKNDPRVWLTAKLGPRKAKQKLREIAAYFALVRTREAVEP